MRINSVVRVLFRILVLVVRETFRIPAPETEQPESDPK